MISIPFFDSEAYLGALKLQNRLVMLPMTPSRAVGKIHTNIKGMQPFHALEVMTFDEVINTVTEYAKATKNGIKASFEIHAANGYLFE